MKNKVLIGMSGGVDSSLAAAMLLEQGYETIGITFLLGDYAPSAREDAERVAKHLGIRHETVDFSKEFKNEVMDYFAAEYEHGRTPNPCVMCNRKIKFGKFLELADSMNAEYIATGHYAKIKRNSASGLYELHTADVLKKDQSYFLYNMTQKELSRTIMPLSDISKDETRQKSECLGLPTAHRPDSQDVCFIPDGDYISFLRKYAGFEDKKGLFKTTDGTVLGEHNGIAHFTIGQRKGLGITFGKPMFVTGLDAKTNTVYLGEKGSEFTEEFTASGLTLTSGDAISAPFEVSCKIRSQAPFEKCSITPIDKDRIKIKMQNPARAVTPGQSIVFYDGTRVLGGAVIENMY